MLYPNIVWSIRQGGAQFQLAAKLGESESWLSRRLTGRVNFSVEDKARISQALGYPAEWLFATPNPPSRETIAEYSGATSLGGIMPDLQLAQCTVAANGNITVVTKTFMNKAQVTAVAGGLASSTSTVTTGTDWVQVSTVLVPSSPQTQTAAETNTYVGDNQNPSSVGTVK